MIRIVGTNAIIKRHTHQDHDNFKIIPQNSELASYLFIALK